METAFDLIKKLVEHQVEFVVVGGVAGAFHGSPLTTTDLDVCAPLTHQNMMRIAAALKPLNARHRMHPRLPPLDDNPDALKGWKNVNLLTDLGQIDFLGDLPGIGEYDEVRRHIVIADLDGVRCQFLDLDTLIAAKRSAGRTKDKMAIELLERVREERRRMPPSKP